MSWRERRFEQAAKDDEAIELYCDFDSGTWRLFVSSNNLCVDLTLAQIKELTARLNQVIHDIETNESNNAEIIHAQLLEAGVL